jgi:hypothetical protein
MKNLVLKFIEIDENTGCDNGIQDKAIAYIDNKKAGQFQFCRCGNGCAGTDDINAFRHFKFVFPEEKERK